jgi:hypothetical protein
MVARGPDASSAIDVDAVYRIALLGYDLNAFKN